MAKLYFRYGAMGSSKTANALMVRYNYIERGQKVLMLKPKVDNRDGDQKIVSSRIGISAPCEYIDEFITYAKEHWHSPEDTENYACIIVDEAQFMTCQEVEYMAYIVDFLNIPVICYGLRTDFQSKMFPGAARLFELADVIEQVPTVCWCGKKAHFNARFVDGKIVREGEQVFIGGNESYIALCRRHFTLGWLKDPEV